MNALNHSFDDIETAPPAVAMPILIECAAIGARQLDDVEFITNSARYALDQIQTSTSQEAAVFKTIRAMEGWAQSAKLTPWVAARPECLRVFSDTEARASLQTMHTVATIKAWRARQHTFVSGQLLMDALLHQTFAPRDVDVCNPAIVGSMSLFTRISTLPHVDFDFIGAIDSLLLPDTSALAGYDRYTVPNWDGDHAEPISLETVAAARSLLQVLPSNFGEPDFAPAADGTIGLEWIPDTGSLRKLFIDVGPKTVWRAYWKFANGQYGEANGLTSDQDISDTMKKLFCELSK